ncbi:hypothetical protein F4703DRAFT_1823785 [Phycomyces blakesleeanus]
MSWIKIINLAKNIVAILTRHHALINQLKEDRYNIIVYCRKSTIPSINRAALLQIMAVILHQRPLADKMSVSPCSSAKKSFFERDLQKYDSFG